MDEAIKINYPIEIDDWYLFTNHYYGFVNGLE
jgi:hypothetical protein